MTSFKFPADAMRAKIRGDLNCSWCKNITDNDHRWCTKRQYVPLLAEKIDDQFCWLFRLRNEQHYLKAGWVIDPSFYAPEPTGEVGNPPPLGATQCVPPS